MSEGIPMTDVLEDVLAYSREADYVGWDKHDGMSSRVREALPFETKWTNLLFQESIKRAPVNLRPLLLVEQRRSFLGAALFALANLRAAELADEQCYRREAQELLDWIVDMSSPGYSGFCGGHQHTLQSLDGTQVLPEVPGVVGTAVATRALIVGDEQFDTDYGDIASTAADFVLEDLSYRRTEDGACINYKPTDSANKVVLNANALGARCLLDIAVYRGDDALREKAEAILNYVSAKQLDIGGWEYTEPPSASYLDVDNFHNGYIIETFLDHREQTGSKRYSDVLDRALRFYRAELFDANGAPHYDTENTYPRNIHDVAQGTIVFSKAGDREFARRILDWGLQNLYGGDGQFYFEQSRFWTKSYTLMRWCEAWMAVALSTIAGDPSG